jgi:hypothetical protein
MYTEKHWLLALLGENVSDQSTDVWQCNLRLSSEGTKTWPQNFADRSAILDDVGADVLTWWNAIRASFHTTTRLAGFKFNMINTLGLYESDTETMRRDLPGTSQPGSATSAPLPSQVAMAVTFLTDAQRGLASKGRFFLPGPAAISVDQTRRINEGTRNTIQTATATLLTNLGNWPGADTSLHPGVPVVMSDVREGATRKIVGVSVGKRFDVQRRRANKYPELRPPATAVT